MKIFFRLKSFFVLLIMGGGLFFNVNLAAMARCCCGARAAISPEVVEEESTKYCLPTPPNTPALEEPIFLMKKTDGEYRPVSLDDLVDTVKLIIEVLSTRSSGRFALCFDDFDQFADARFSLEWLRKFYHITYGIDETWALRHYHGFFIMRKHESSCIDIFNRLKDCGFSNFGVKGFREYGLLYLPDDVRLDDPLMIGQWSDKIYSKIKHDHCCLRFHLNEKGEVLVDFSA